jgi:molybdate transport system ATP-binding protein
MGGEGKLVFDTPTAAIPYMQIEVEQQLGDLLLKVSCELTAPWTVLFGASGAGKTSLLRVLGGLSRPDRGRVLFRGETLTDIAGKVSVPPAQRGIGFVTQHPALFPHMDVAGNVGFGLQTLDKNARKQRIDQMLELFSAEPLIRRKPESLSGGEKQRVILARALAPEPRMLLLDEPFTGLDLPLKESILSRLMGWIKQRNIPALYVSHQVADAFETAADVILLRAGKVEAQGAAPVVLACERERLLQQLSEFALDTTKRLPIS